MHVVLTGTYCCCFQVTAPQVASLNLAFAVDNIIQSATLNGFPLLKVENNTTFPFTFKTLEGKMDAGSVLFKLGTNVLVVKVLNSAAGPYGFYAEGTAIHPRDPLVFARLKGAVEEADTAVTAAADKVVEAKTAAEAAAAEAAAATEAEAFATAAVALDWPRYAVQPKHYSVGRFPRAGQLQA